MTVADDVRAALPLSLFDQGVPAGWAANLPLRVQVYEQVADWIRSDHLAVGDRIPTENELCEMFGLSRTVVREALILLEEDGVVVRTRGVGRFVSAHEALVGLEQMRPIDRLLPNVTMRRLEANDEHPTSLVEDALAVAADATVLRWESLLFSNGQPICLSEEWIVQPIPVRGSAGRVLRSLIAAGDSHATHSLGALVADACRNTYGPSVCRITATKAEERRAELLEIEPGEPLLAIVQITHVGGAPLLCQKHLLRTDLAPLVVNQRRVGQSDPGIAATAPPPTAAQKASAPPPAPADGNPERHPPFGPAKHKGTPP